VSEARAARIDETETAATTSSVEDELRRLGELLDLDLVGVRAPSDAGDRSVSWRAPGAPDEPGDLDTVAAGLVDSWLGERLDDGSIVYAHRTPESSPRAASVLRSVGPSLSRSLAQTSELEPGSGGTTEPVRRVIEATRSVLENPEATVPDLLFAFRGSLDADEVFHLVDRGGDVEVTSSPSTERLRRIPREIQAKVQALPRGTAFEEATARQLAVVVGAKSPFVAGAFCLEREPTEVFLVGWAHDPRISPAAMSVIATMAGAGRAALDTRRRAVDALFTKERNRLAYEIHDGVTQAVTTSVLELEALTHKIERDPKDAIQTLGVSKSEIRRALSELRGILFELSRDKSSEPVADDPLAKYVQDVVRRWRLPARITVKGDLHHVPKPLLGAAYVVIREALANAAKHAAGHNVTVWVGSTEKELVVEVADGGRGFNTSRRRTDREGKHFGLEMMERRVAEAGGRLEVDSAPGRGTRITARLPIEGEDGDG
jgi:signal transduction histidine kinase